MSTGKFVWFDLMSSDRAAARKFYSSLFGWDIEAHGEDYAMCHLAGQPFAGIAPVPQGVPSHWTPYVSTDDIAATLARVRSEGGKVLHEWQSEEIGKSAVVADRQNAVISVIQLLRETPSATHEKGAGHLSWSELHTTNPSDALEFYKALFAWKDETWGGDYYLVGDEHNAGILRAHPGVPSHWLAYANVTNADATTAEAKKLGASVVLEPREMQGVGRFAVLCDPTGATFAIMQSKRRE